MREVGDAHDDALAVQTACGRALQGLVIRLTAVIREGLWVRLEGVVIQMVDIVGQEELAGACGSPPGQAPWGPEV